MAPNISADHHASSTTKCYSAVLRRLLCSGSLPTHPSDNLATDPREAIHPFEPAEENAKLQGGGSSNPGVVARLMGLDSFPNSPCSTQHDGTLGSYFRSRSVNSIDFISHFDLVKQHRRVRTSVSFREGMYYYDCNVGAAPLSETAGEKGNKKEKRGGSGNSGKVREKDAIKKREGQSKERRAVAKKAVKAKDETIAPTTKVVKKRQKPHSGCKVHPQGITAPAAGLAKVGGGVSPIRRGSPSKVVSPQSSYSNNYVEVRAVKRGKKAKRSTKKDNYYYKRMVEVICGLTDESVSENWTQKFEDLDEICQQFGQEILQVLLKQFVDELAQPTTIITGQKMLLGFQNELTV